jgi:alpha-glucosidase (family GH31 glycosyl hydrolase)
VIALRAEVIGDGLGDVRATGLAFGAARDERFFGFGERSNAVDQRGNEVESYVADGPYTPPDRALVPPLPPWGFDARDDSTYYPIPWLLSSRGYGVLSDDDRTSRFHAASDRPDRWSFDVDSTIATLRFFAGPTPADVLRRFTARTGRQPPPPAPWTVGPWFQTGQANLVPLDREAQLVATLQGADAPVSVAETHMRYLPCGAQQGLRDVSRQRSDAFHQRGLAVLTYFNPMICQSNQPAFDDAARAGALTRDATGQPYVYGGYVGEAQGVPFRPLGQFDFTTPAGRDAFDAQLAQGIDDGYDGWMEDFGEYSPPDGVFADGTPGVVMHNRYPRLFHCAAYDFAQRQARPIVRFQRSGWTNTAPCATVVWGGDNTTVWGYDGLQSAVREALSMGLSGVARWGSDIGGFHTLDDDRLTPELLARWIEFGSVSAVMRTKSEGFAVPSYTRPQIWDPDLLPIWRRYAKLHTQLYPYLAAADGDYRATGMPIMRALALQWPDDARAAGRDDEFLLGGDLLAAPVLEPETTARNLYLPPGRWIADPLAFDARTGAFHLRDGKPLDGGRSVDARAPLDTLPLFARAGAIIPLLSPDVDTLSDYGSDPGIVHLRDRANVLRLLAYPSGRSAATFYDDGRVFSVLRRKTWSLSVSGARRRTYEVEAALPFKPCALGVGRKRVRGWSYAGGVLRAAFATTRGRLVVTDC